HDNSEFPASLEYQTNDGQAVSLSVELTVRGDASLSVCAFPKLRMQIKKGEPDRDSPFYEDKTINIGTHCSDDDKISNYGKLLGEHAVYREVLVYKLLNSLQIPGMQVRPGLTKYIDTNENRTIAQKQSFLLETPENLAQRLDYKLLKSKNDTWPRDYYKKIDRQQLANILMFNILIGNSDFEINLDGGDFITRNIILLEARDHSILPISYDFDLATMVSGRLRRIGSGPDEQASYIIPDQASSYQDILNVGFVKLRQILKADELKDAIKYFKKKSNHIEEVLESFPLDNEGKQYIKIRFDAFKQVLDRN
ncbi:MAG: hypothetical protein NTX25_20335, partial [Proteobacteria bacterium]|nr:hypothetical protein [Pseudomonadota bacterium]